MIIQLEKDEASNWIMEFIISTSLWNIPTNFNKPQATSTACASNLENFNWKLFSYVAIETLASGL